MLHTQLQSYRGRQKFLYACDDTAPIVHRTEFVSETYNKTIVHADGTMTHNVSLPAVLWLGDGHVCAYINLPLSQLLVLHKVRNESEPLNVWWQQWRDVPPLRGDIVLARRHAHYTHDAAVFASVM